MKMTRTEAMEWFKNALNNNDFLPETVEVFKTAIEALSADVGWIQCSEGLPKVGEQVLCCDSQLRVFTSALTEIASNGMAFFGQHCKVIAWMPLPKPYGERREP